MERISRQYVFPVQALPQCGVRGTGDRRGFSHGYVGRTSFSAELMRSGVRREARPFGTEARTFQRAICPGVRPNSFLKAAMKADPDAYPQ